MYKNIIKARKKGKCILYSSISRISYWTPMLVTINPCVLVCDYFCTVTRIPIQRQRLEYTKPCSRTDRDKQTIQRCASRATEKPCHSDGVSMGFILNASPCTRAWVRNASGASEGSSHGDPWVRVRNRGWSWPKPRASATALTGLPWPECTPSDGEVPPKGNTASVCPELTRLLLVEWTAVRAGSQFIQGSQPLSASIHAGWEREPE